MRHLILASGLTLTIACAGMAVAQTETTSTTTTTTTADMSPEQRTEFHQYVVKEHRSSVNVEHFDVVTGAVLPPTVEFYEVPKVEKYRYTVVNQHRVLVDPVTRRIVEVEVDKD